MKKIGILLLLPLMLLCGCGEKETEAALQIQQQYAQVATAEMEADITCHLAQENRTFTVRCCYEADGVSTATVTAPESLAGITAEMEGDNLAVTYGGVSMPAGMLEDVCPANMMPYLLQALAEGYLLDHGTEVVNGVDCQRLTLDTSAPGGEKLLCSVWLDTETLIPRFAEIATEDGHVALSLKMLSFSCTLKEE